ncbi:uncharacterized protein ACLA_033940 [Aspergillus clavatus NRRL 1]|uniref:Uncharacterized protein n=1 Tax=Aspergillus clavatus (strain ATCC 1007 / CBS 513.65 / DSM 816 / NCTC 3887 / NRRL 1 / QM 1276 / 107) TaxID=344612 RepID=A1CJ67_ASPCL|nr:uncharacterized protein ACLA_033940 [Aspergillus clavatus NRRL 1]EAW09191.1 hypothetical protein ACLA_033940 [Aspergillus clavatus NRRL 1]
MSGFNPFRPKRLESENDPPLPKFGLDATRPSRAYHNSSPSSVSTHSYFPAPSSTTASVTNSSSTPYGYTGTPPESYTSDVDDSQSSDDQSLSDPFQKNFDVTDRDVEDGAAVRDGIWNSSRLPRSAPADDRRSSMYANAAPHSAPALPGSSSSVSSAPVALPTKHDAKRETSRYSLELGNQTEPGSLAVDRLGVPATSSPRGMNSANSGATLTSQYHTSAGVTSRPMVGTPSSSEAEVDSRALAARSGNRERKPPPPPKSHHGKLINPSPQASPSQSQPRLRLTNRFSYHGTSSETSLSLTPDSPSSRPSQQGVDYFTNLDDTQSTQSTESLRRSQSQHKRPPTPPLSRRHSQMRRSKSTMSRTNLVRLSMPVEASETNFSSPPSPGPWPTASPRLQESRLGPPRPDEAGHGSGPSELPSSRRASQVNPVPPLPPPRRTRVSSSHSNTGGPTFSPEKEKRAPQEDFVPHPSNANDILADLSRLQKEVDDLRGHYEGRKVSQ